MSPGEAQPCHFNAMSFFIRRHGNLSALRRRFAAAPQSEFASRIDSTDKFAELFGGLADDSKLLKYSDEFADESDEIVFKVIVTQFISLMERIL